jgi:hypothetical protein
LVPRWRSSESSDLFLRAAPGSVEMTGRKPSRVGITVVVEVVTVSVVTVVSVTVDVGAVSFSVTVSVTVLVDVAVDCVVDEIVVVDCAVSVVVTGGGVIYQRQKQDFGGHWVWSIP